MCFQGVKWGEIKLNQCQESLQPRSREYSPSWAHMTFLETGPEIISTTILSVISTTVLSLISTTILSLISTTILSLLLIQIWQSSVTGKSMCI